MLLLSGGAPHHLARHAALWGGGRHGYTVITTVVVGGAPHHLAGHVALWGGGGHGYTVIINLRPYLGNIFLVKITCIYGWFILRDLHI